MMPTALGLAGDAHRVEVRDEVGHRNGRIEHGDIDVLPFTGGVTVAKGGEHPDHAEQAELISPSAPTGLTIGGRSGSRLYS